MTRYAQETSVSVERSKAEIEHLLARYGATKFLSGWDQERAVIAFEMGGRRMQLTLPLPRKDAEEFKWTPARRFLRDAKAQHEAWEQSCRQRWRALALVIKAKLEAVEAGIVSHDDEWLAYTLLPDGSTVGQWSRPQIAQVYETGQMPPLMLTAGDR